MNIPASINAGDTLSWKDGAARDGLNNSLTSDLWTLTYALRGLTGVDLVAVPEGQGWKTTITTAQSAGLAPGNYAWAAYVQQGGDATTRLTIGNGSICVMPNIAAAPTDAAFDGRSQLEKDLADIDEAIRRRVAKDAPLKKTIGNRALEKEPLSGLRSMREDYARRLQRQRVRDSIRNGRGNPKTLLARFTRT